ncbi:MAG: hypothetical protein V2A64_01105 [Candidatus Omnitrophota bacterium]
MREHLIDILQDIIDLLMACGFCDRALWFIERLNRVKSIDVLSSDLQVLLKEIDDIIWGAGSFSDLSLVPKNNVDFTRKQARQLQRTLASALSEEIEKIQKTIPKVK